MDEQDRRDRAELIERDARLKAMQKLAEPKP
jgi:tetrahydromethanopterin S-methyltransferase subunit F